jgi:hypothetical protein
LPGAPAPYSPALIGASSIPSSISLNDQVNAIRYLQGIPLSGQAERPIAVLRQSVAQSIPTGVLTPILMDSEDLDTANGHSTTTNTARYTCPTGEAGWYRGIGQYVAAANATGSRVGVLVVNGSTRKGQQGPLPGDTSLETAVQVSAVFFLNAGDYVEMCGYHNRGSALSTTLTAMPSFLTIYKERLQ